MDALFQLLVSPFVWLFNIGRNILGFFKEKQKENKNQKTYEKYYKDDFRKEQTKEEKRQQKQSYGYTKETRDDTKKEYQRKVDEQKKKAEENKHPRWDSKNAYVILGIDSNATRKEIKKARNNLARIYHPDTTLTKKDEYEVIMKKINWAYDLLI